MFEVYEVPLTVAEKIQIFLIWFLIEIFGNGMLFGLIHFDIFSGDPLKRRISDQVGQCHSLIVVYDRIPITEYGKDADFWPFHKIEIFL